MQFDDDGKIARITYGTIQGFADIINLQKLI